MAGARLAWGGKPLEGHSIPEVYGAIQPTAVFVPLDQILGSDANWEAVNTELFGPFQVRASLKRNYAATGHTSLITVLPCHQGFIACR